MPAYKTILKVFVACPEDLDTERTVLEDAIAELNLSWSQSSIMLELIRWETHAHPGFGVDAQDVINQQIGNDYDIFIGILWTRFGTPTGRASSGTAEEFERAYRRFQKNPKQLQIMFYFKKEPVSPSEIDPEQLAKVNEFRRKLGEQGGLYGWYSDLEDFKKLMKLHLIRQVQDWQSGAWGTENAGDLVQNERKQTSFTPPTVQTELPETEEYGLLDYVEIGTESFETVTEVVDQITDTLVSLTQKMEKRIAEIQELTSTSGTYDTKTAKRVLERTATDLEQFGVQIQANTPIFASTYSKGMDAWSKAAILWESDFDTEEIATIEEALEAAQSLRSNIQGAQTSLGYLRDSITPLPRMTSSFNRAKRNAVSVVDDLYKEMVNAVQLAIEVEKVFERIIQNYRSNQNDESDGSEV